MSPLNACLAAGRLGTEKQRIFILSGLVNQMLNTDTARKVAKSQRFNEFPGALGVFAVQNYSST
jgi:hypothetical protein